jgi:hypothetical protein
MNDMKTLATRRRAALLGAALTVAALGLTLGLPVSSDAAGGCGIGYRYYSDAAHTNQIGERGRTPEACGCTLDFWGVTSSHYELFGTSC